MTETISCESILLQKAPELAAKIKAGTATLEEIKQANEILKSEGWQVIGWAGGDATSRSKLYYDPKIPEQFFNDIRDYPSSKFQFFTQPPDHGNLTEFTKKNLLKRDVNIGLYIVSDNDSDEETLGVSFIVKESNELIHIPLKGVKPDLCSKIIQNITQKNQGQDNLAALNSLGLTEEEERLFFTCLKQTIESNGGVSYIGNWQGVYATTSPQHAASYASSSSISDLDGKIKDIPSLQLIYVSKGTVIQGVVGEPLSTDNAHRFAQLQQEQAASENSVRVLYGGENENFDLNNYYEGGEGTEIVILGPLNEHVLFLPLSPMLTAFYIDKTQHEDRKWERYVKKELEIDVPPLTGDIEILIESIEIPKISEIAIPISLRGDKASNFKVVEPGASKGKTENNAPCDNFMRMLMRYPKDEVADNIVKIYKQLCTMFKDILVETEYKEALGRLYAASQGDARGGCESLEKLIEFLKGTELDEHGKSKNMSGLISKTCILMAGIGYRLLDLKTKPDTVPDIDKRLLEKVADVIFARHIGETYKGRYVKKADGSYQSDIVEEPGDESIQNNGRLVSTASTDGCTDAPHRSDGRAIRLLNNLNQEGQEQTTWIGNAFIGGVPFRNHVSSGLPLDLAVCESLLGFAVDKETGKWPEQDKEKYKEQLMDLAAAIFLPHYARADYHSLAEAWAAVKFFIEERTIDVSKMYEPEELLDEAVEIMRKSVHPLFHGKESCSYFFERPTVSTLTDDEMKKRKKCLEFKERTKDATKDSVKGLDEHNITMSFPSKSS